MHFILNKSSKTCLLYIRIDKKRHDYIKVDKKSMKRFSVFGKKKCSIYLDFGHDGLGYKAIPSFLSQRLIEGFHCIDINGVVL